MRIGINLLAFQPDRIGGLEHYVRRLLAALQARTAHELVLFLPPGLEAAFAEAPGRMHLRSFALEEGDAALVKAMREETLDLWWCPWVVWRPLRPPVPSVVTVPDLQHEHLPDSLTPEERLERRADYLIAAHCAHAVMTFSKHTRDDLRQRYGVPPDRVFAIPLDVGYDWDASAPEPELVADLMARHGTGFLYYPANTWPHKDHLTLLRALRRLADQGEPQRLVLTGAGDHERGRLERMIRDQGLNDAVHLLGTVPPPVVRGLYRLCAAVVFPSRFEGFGMPVLEGMRSGVPVLSSDATSLPEVGGDAALYFRAGDVDDLAEKIRRITGDEALRADLVKRGTTRAAGFSWTDTARAADEVFAFARRSGPPDTAVATGLNSVFDRLLGQLSDCEADRVARLALIQQGEADRSARLDVIERMAAGVREGLAMLEQAIPRSFHGLAWPREVKRVRRTIDQSLQRLRDLLH